MAYKITANNGGMYPPKILVDDDVIVDTDDNIDAELPDSCKVAGAIIYSADMKKIRQRNFDDEWVYIKGNEE